MNDTEDLNELFNSIGFGFPENSEQIAKFGKIFKNYSFEANVNKIDPKRILESIEVNKSEVVSNVEYHKRTVLAAEIVFRLKDEWSLGHLKLQKLIYLCQNAMSMPIHANFLKQAMGPYDPKLMRSLDGQFEERKWFRFQSDPDKFPKYIFLEKAGEHKVWYDRYFQKTSSKVDFIIDEFRDMKTAEVELVATIFASWTEKKNLGVEITDNVLIDAVYSWSKEKVKFKREDIERSIEWMKRKGITPLKKK